MNDLASLRQRRIGVLCGGVSAEREVSLRSGQGVREALLRQGFDAVAVDPQPPLLESLLESGMEVAFNALHGGMGEDGTIQAVLEYLRIPYTGSGVLGCAVTMHKLATKRLLRSAGLPTPDWDRVGREEPLGEAVERVVAHLGLPVVLKPVSEGSSLGVSIPKTRTELEADLGAVVAQYGQALVERFVPGSELTVGVIGSGSRAQDLHALPVLELVPHNEFYDYEAKYTKGLTDLIVPARISEETTREAQRLGAEAHAVTECFGVSRTDMHLDEAGRLWITEINSMPGMTETSDLPAAAAAEGMSYDDLVLEILRSALARR